MGIESPKEREREVIAHYADEYLKNTPTDTLGYILPAELKQMLDNGQSDALFLLDVREPDDYRKFYIPGTVNIWFKELARPENLAKIPRDKQIIVICYVGHTSSQVLAILGMLGYRVKGLKFGMGVVPVPGMCKNGWLESYYPFESG